MTTATIDQALDEAQESPHHLKAAEVLWDPARFKFLLVGRRGGKTTTFVEDCMKSIPECPDGGEIYFIGPTNSHAMELYWDQLAERLSELGYAHRPLISKQCFRLTRRRKIYVIGAEKIKRIRGHKVFRAYLDEVAYYEVELKEVWKAVRPALSDLHGHCYMGTTPDGKGSDCYAFYLELMRLGQFKFFHWTSKDNPFLDPQEIEEAKADLDAKGHSQEYEATWESFGDVAYYNFQESVHVKQCAEFRFDTPLCMMLDFNVNPTTLLLGEHYQGFTSVRKEYSLRNNSTEKTVEQFVEDFKGIKEKMDKAHAADPLGHAPFPIIEVYGDASGKNRKSNVVWSDYKILQDILLKHGFEFRMCVPGGNPPILDRVKYLNGWLKNVHGQHRIEVDPSCTELVMDLGAQELDGRYPSDEGNRGHKADALGYHVWWKQVVGGRKESGSEEL